MTRRDLKAECVKHSRCTECTFIDYTGCIVKCNGKRGLLMPREYPDDILDDEVHMVTNKFYEAYAIAIIIVIMLAGALAVGSMLGNWLWEVMMP